MSPKVYFAAARGRIKIGMSTSVEVRLAQLTTRQTGPLTLLGTIPGWRDEERRLHTHFRQYWIEGEWFTDCAAIRSEIARILAAGEFPSAHEVRQRERSASEASRDAPWNRLKAEREALTDSCHKYRDVVSLSAWRQIRTCLEAATFRQLSFNIRSHDIENDPVALAELIAQADSDLRSTSEDIEAIVGAFISPLWNVADSYLRGAA